MSEIRDDKLIRSTPVYSNGDGSFMYVQNKIVITKEEFLVCYNEWILKPMRENSISVQGDSGFCIPVDNNGGTPV